MGTCRQQHCLAWLGLVLLVEGAAVSSATAVPAAASATAVQHATVAVTASKKVQQPLWLQDAVRNSKQPGLSSRQTGQDQKQPRHPPASAQPLQTVAAAPYIMLKRSHTVKHSHRVSAPKDMTVRISSRGGMRGGVLYRTGPISQGHTTSVTFRVPEGNEYLGVGVFAWDLEPTANIDITLSLGDTEISRSNNPAGLDDFLEALEGVEAGEYTVNVTAVTLLKATTVPVYVWLMNERKARAEIATPLPVTVRPSQLQLTTSPSCCSVELSVGDIQLSNMPVSRYICVLQYTRPDGSPLPGAPTTIMYLL